MPKSDDSIQPKNNDEVLNMKTFFMSQKSNKSDSSSSSSMSSTDTFSSVSKLPIYKKTMQCEEVNPKFSKQFNYGNVLHNSAKLEKARDIILPLLEDSELNGKYKGVFGSELMNYIRESICAGTKNNNEIISDFKGSLSHSLVNSVPLSNVLNIKIQGQD